MKPHDSVPPPTEQVLALIRGELSSPRRWLYRLILTTTSIVVAAILSLWLTEPGPLPIRLHVAFAAMTAIGFGWIGVLTWILTRRNCPSVQDRVATGWMATVACSLFLAVSVPISLIRGHTLAAFWLGVTGLALLGVALLLLRGAYSLRARLRSQLRHTGLRFESPG
jgi:hypothetical protein